MCDPSDQIQQVKEGMTELIALIECITRCVKNTLPLNQQKVSFVQHTLTISRVYMGLIGQPDCLPSWSFWTYKSISLFIDICRIGTFHIQICEHYGHRIMEF